MGSIQDLRDLAAPLLHAEVLPVDITIQQAVVTYINKNDRFFLQAFGDAGIFAYVKRAELLACAEVGVGDELTVHVTELKNYNQEREISAMDCRPTGTTGISIPPTDIGGSGITEDILGRSAIITGQITNLAADLKTYTVSAGTEVIVYDDGSGEFTGFTTGDMVTVTGPLVQYQEVLELKIDSTMGSVEAVMDPTPEPTPMPESGNDIQYLRSLGASLGEGQSLTTNVTISGAIVTYMTAMNQFFMEEPGGAGIYVYLDGTDIAYCGGLSVGDEITVTVTGLKNYSSEIEVTEMACFEKTDTGLIVDPLDISTTGVSEDILGRSATVFGWIASIDGSLYTLGADGVQVYLYDNGSGKLADYVLGDTLQATGPLVQHYSTLELKIDPAMGNIVPWSDGDPGVLPYHRNEMVFSRQGNRNPFVDNPDWVDEILDF